MRRQTGFTLIELLIVIAIIAILALIAIPNFLQAQVRAKVSRAKADMRSIATAVEAYYIDHNAYVGMNPYSYGYYVEDFINDQQVYERLTTPVAYMTGQSGFQDPFGWPVRGYFYGHESNNRWIKGSDLSWTDDPDTEAERLCIGSYYYAARLPEAAGIWYNILENADTKGQPIIFWVLQSKGPDGKSYALGNAITYTLYEELTPYAHENAKNCIYDITNGVQSEGSIFRVGGQKAAQGEVFFEAVAAAD